MFYLKHGGSWFGFAEPARFQSDSGGGYFVNLKGEEVRSLRQFGYKPPQFANDQTHE